MEWNLKTLESIYSLAQSSGYRCAFFGETPPDGPHIYWRHDVDFCPDAALKVAQLELSMGISSTFFVMDRSAFYVTAETRELETFLYAAPRRHRSGAHLVDGQRVGYDEYDLEPWSRHRPRPEDIGRDSRFDPYDAYGTRYTLEAKYLSDSRHHFREGPIEDFLDAEKYPRLQINLHPEWWVYTADTQAEAVDLWLHQHAERTRQLIRGDQEIS